MKYSLIITLLGSLAIGSVSAATLTPKRGVDILYINGEASQSKIGQNKINEGFNQVVLKMNKDMSRGSSSDVFTSKPFVVAFTVEGDEVVIDHPVARSINEAQRAFENNDPKWFIKVDGSLIEYNQSMIEGRTGFLPFSGLEKRVAQHNAEQGIYFKDGQLIDKPAEALTVEQAATATAVTTAAVASPTTTTSVNSETVAKVDNVAASTTQASTEVAQQIAAPQNVEQLKAWYLKASKEERKAFRRWMIDQE